MSHPSDLYPPPTTPRPRWSDRYEPIRPLGSGAFGEVWLAHDHHSGENVAIKRILVVSDTERARFRNELIALREAQVPGVVPLLDDFVDGAFSCLVMPVIDGKPFPGASGPLPWSALRPLLARLARTLGFLHARGVAHLDLKPTNVLVTADGTPWVLDLGIARCATVQGVASEAYLTPAWAAPEQLDGRETSPATDRYALGMLWLHGWRGAPTAACPGAPWALPSALPELCDEIDTLRALLALEPQDRPADTLAIARALGLDHTDFPALRALHDPATPTALRALFAGPDRFTHLAEDAADTLFDRTGGQHARVVDELDAWLGAGLAVLTEGGAQLTRDAIHRLAFGEPALPAPHQPLPADRAPRAVLAAIAALFPHATPERVAALLERDAVDDDLHDLLAAGHAWHTRDGSLGCTLTRSTDVTLPIPRIIEVLPETAPQRLIWRLASEEPLETVVPRVLLWAERCLAQGAESHPIPLLSSCLVRARRNGADHIERRLVEALATHHIAEETVSDTDAALRMVEATLQQHPWLRSVAHLLRAARAALTRDAPRLRAALAEVTELEGEALDAWRRSLAHRLARAAGEDAEQAWLDDNAGWASTTPYREGKWTGWYGLLRHRQARYEEAVVWFERSIRLKTAVADRLSSEINLALSRLETERPTALIAPGRDLARRAQEARLHRIEAIASFIERTAHLRARQLLAPERANVAALAGVEPRIAATHAVNESLFAAAYGDLATCAEIALLGVRCAARAGATELRLFLYAIHSAAGGAVPDEAATRGLAAVRHAPSLLLQIAALRGFDDLDLEDKGEVQRALERVPAHRRTHPLELATIDELLSVQRFELTKHPANTARS